MLRRVLRRVLSRAQGYSRELRRWRGVLSGTPGCTCARTPSALSRGRETHICARTKALAYAHVRARTSDLYHADRMHTHIDRSSDMLTDTHSYHTHAHTCVRVRVRACLHACAVCECVSECVWVSACMCVERLCVCLGAVRALWWHGGDRRF